MPEKKDNAVSTMQSDSRLGVYYTVCVSDDGILYCDCPSWKFQHACAQERRPCKHIKRYLAGEA